MLYSCLAPTRFKFQRRVSPVSWRDVMRANLDAVIKTGDVAPLKNVLQTAVFSRVTEDELANLPVNCSVMLVRVLQLAVEVLQNEKVPQQRAVVVGSPD